MMRQRFFLFFLYFSIPLNAMVDDLPPQAPLHQNFVSKEQPHIDSCELSLSGKGLSSIDDIYENINALNGKINFLKIKKLTLSSNDINYFKLSRILSIFPRLKRLDLSHNKIKKLSSDVLSGMPNCFYLDLSNNCIKKVADNAFNDIGVRGIVLDLRYNPINKVMLKLKQDDIKKGRPDCFTSIVRRAKASDSFRDGFLFLLMSAVWGSAAIFYLVKLDSQNADGSVESLSLDSQSADENINNLLINFGKFLFSTSIVTASSSALCFTGAALKLKYGSLFKENEMIIDEEV